MTDKTTWVTRAILATLMVSVPFAGLATGCSGDEDDGNSSGIYPVGAGGASSGPGSGGMDEPGPACQEGVIRECKVQIDENNCFVGEEQCQDGAWSPCADAGSFGTASFETKAISMQGNCAANPCNPYCQQFDEDPATDITAVGSGLPPGGAVNGLPSSWQDAGLRDINHSQASPCTSSGYCQFDHYCDTTICNANGCGACVPWANGAFDPIAGGPNLTIPVVCDADVRVCNRGDVATTGPVHVLVFDANPGNFGLCTGMAPLTSECTSMSSIGPGQCIQVAGCDISGTKTVTVNSTDYLPNINPPAETDCADNWSLSHNSATCNCSATTAAASFQPVNIFFMVDDSGSMVSQGIWQPAQDALNNFFASPAADPFDAALRFYGSNPTSGCDGTSCSAAACDDFQIPLGSLATAHQTTLINAVNAQDCCTSGDGTPHRAAVAGACNAAAAYSAANPGEQEVVIYISDGAYPAQCGGTMAAIAGPCATALATQGVLTFTVALPSASVALLNAISAAGGTTSTIDLTATPPAQVAAEMTTALAAIAGTLVTCSMTIPNAGQVDPAQIVVEYLPGGVPPAVPFVEVANAAACTGGNEYYLDDPMNPTEVTMCPAPCGTVQADVSAVVNVTGGCLGGYSVTIPPTETYFGDCSAYTASGPTWQFFRYDTTIPGDATVVFEARTAHTLADLALSPWLPIAIADSVTPDALPATPIDLEAALTTAYADREYLELRMTLNPTSDGAEAPTVHDWDLQFSCYPNE